MGTTLIGWYLTHTTSHVANDMIQLVLALKSMVIFTFSGCRNQQKHVKFKSTWSQQQNTLHLKVTLWFNHLSGVILHVSTALADIFCHVQLKKKKAGHHPSIFPSFPLGFNFVKKLNSTASLFEKANHIPHVGLILVFYVFEAYIYTSYIPIL